MGVDRLGHIQNRLDKEKNREKTKKRGSIAARSLLAAGVVLGSGAATNYALDHFPRTPEYQAGLDTATTLKKLADDKNRLPVEQFTAEKRQLPDKLILTVALLAHSNEPKYADFEKDPALGSADKVSQGLVLPLVHRKKVDAGYWRNLSEELRGPNSEPSVQRDLMQTADVRFDILKDLSDKYGGVEPIQLEESVAYVARNLHFKHEEPTVQNVQAEVRSILERREALAYENLFDRNVLLVAADEIWSVKSGAQGLAGTPRFGNAGLQDAIKEKMRASGNTAASLWGTTPLVHDASGYHSTTETVAHAKKQTLSAVAQLTDPLTVFFRGHGGYGFFDLSHNFGSGPENSISAKELANALTDRWHAEKSKNPNASELNISFVFDDCMMQTFVRSLSETLASNGVPLPHVMITSSEWEQYSYSSFDRIGTEVGEMLLHNPDLGSIMQRKHDVKSSDPSIFTPRKDDPEKLMQVSGIFVPKETGTA
jgi:hypothetical protein